MSNEPIKLNLAQAKITEVKAPNVLKTSPDFDDVKVKEHFAKIEKLVNEQQGKKGYNPFIWLQQNVNTLVDRYRGWVEPIFEERIINGVVTQVKVKEIKHPPERTKELFDAIMSLPLEIPPVEMSKDTNPTEYNIHQQRPLGLNLPQKAF